MRRNLSARTAPASRGGGGAREAAREGEAAPRTAGSRPAGAERRHAELRVAARVELDDARRRDGRRSASRGFGGAPHGVELVAARPRRLELERDDAARAALAGRRRAGSTSTGGLRPARSKRKRGPPSAVARLAPPTSSQPERRGRARPRAGARSAQLPARCWIVTRRAASSGRAAHGRVEQPREQQAEARQAQPAEIGHGDARRRLSSRAALRPR